MIARLNTPAAIQANVEKLTAARAFAEAEADAAASRALQAYNHAETVEGSNAEDIFRKEGDRYVAASENWRIAAQRVGEQIGRYLDLLTSP